MKIALMTNNYKPFIAGVPISIERLAEGLKELGHEVTVFAPIYKEQEEEADVFRYHSILEGVAGGVVIPSPIDLRIEKEFRKKEFDVIHVHHPMLIGKTAAYLSKKYGIPLTFTYHTRYEQYLHYALPKKLLKQERFADFTGKVVAKYLHSFMKHCDHIFVPTKGMHEYLTDSCLYDGTISVLPTGLEEAQYQVLPEKAAEIRTQYGAENIPLFCSVSRMAHEKNIFFLLDAIRTFSQKYGKDFKVLLIGDGPNKKEYEAYCESTGIGKYVVFTGKIPNQELVNFYGACDAFLFASKTETQGIVLLEAFAAGLPVIAVDASGVRDLVEDMRNGFLIPEDGNVFAEKMLALISNRRQRKILKNGAKETSFEYSECEVAKKAACQYNEVVMNYKSIDKTKVREAKKWKISIVS